MEGPRMFHTGKGRMTCTMLRPSSTILAQAHWLAASVRFSLLHFDPPVPSSQSDRDGGFQGRGVPQHPTTRGHCKLPQSTDRTRVITASQQKASKALTDCITVRSDLCAPSFVRTPSNLQVMGVAPPMTSILERQHPVTLSTR
eukprot:XP_014016925.1 PREDICTED: centrosomal protein POC5-like isoform X2 [Salmo salar]